MLSARRGQRNNLAAVNGQLRSAAGKITVGLKVLATRNVEYEFTECRHMHSDYDIYTTTTTKWDIKRSCGLSVRLSLFLAIIQPNISRISAKNPSSQTEAEKYG